MTFDVLYIQKKVQPKFKYMSKANYYLWGLLLFSKLIRTLLKLLL